MKIIPLTKKYLTKAIGLVSSVFPGEDIVSKAFEASVDKDAFEEFISEYTQVKSLEYFIAVDENDTILGTNGLYSLQEDLDDSYWLGWYCVDPNHRGKGIGKALLNYCVDEAKRRGKKYLKLYTSTDPNEAKAQEVYEKSGFYVYKYNGSLYTKQVQKDKGYEIFFRRKNL